MYCSKCGKEVKDSAAFCPNCGAKVNIGAVSENTDKTRLDVTAKSDIKKKKKSKGGIIATLVIAVAVIAAGAGTVMYVTSDSYKISKNVKLAVKSYENADYDDAIKHYEAVLEMDDTRTEIYEAISNVYLEQNECIKAIDVLIKGEKATGDSGLSDREKYVREHVVILKKDELDPDNRKILWSRIEYEYNASGNVTKEVSYSSDEMIAKWYEYEYDNFGNKTNKVLYSSDGTVLERKEYDTSGNVTKEIQYNVDGTISSFDEYEYDISGNETKEARYSSDGVMLWKKEYQYEYDSVGNVTQKVDYNSDGVITAWTEYEYDDFGNMTKFVGYNSDGTMYSWFEYKYDMFNNITEQRNSNGFYNQSWEYTYKYIGD